MKYRTQHSWERCVYPDTPSSSLSLQCLGRLLSAKMCLGLCLVALASQILPAQSLGPAIHRAPKPLTFVTPGVAQTFTKPSVPVQVHITGGMDPATFKIRLNGKNVTDQFTTSGACSPTSCDKSASLSLADGIRSGWNRLMVSVSSDRGAVDTAQSRFRYNDGLLEDYTDGRQPPSNVHVAVQPNGDVQLDYKQGVSGGSTTFSTNCPSNTWSMVAIDRRTLTQPSLTPPLDSVLCFVADGTSGLEIALRLMPFDTIVVVRAPANSSIGAVDMSSIGGTNFKSSPWALPGPFGPTPTVQVQNYSIIGYGQSAPGLAYESYTTNGDNPPGIEGVLEDICCSDTNGDVAGSFYAFRPADQPGFTVSYPNNVAQIEIKYNNDLPLGSAALTPNREIPPGLDLDTVTSATPNGSAIPGIWMAIFYRQNLQLAATNVFTPTAQDPTTAYSQLAAAIYQLWDDTYGTGLASKDALVFIAITQPQNFPTPPHQQYDVVANLSRAIQLLGGSASDFWQAVSSGKHYVLVGTTTDNVASSKQYSTEVDSQQFESGLLHGLLPRNHQMLYTPSQVVPITTNFAQNGDYLWERDILAQISGTRPVAWPYTSDPDHLLAYAWLSQLIVDTDTNGGNPTDFSYTPCKQTDTTCDIRFYYTGDEAGKITGGINPAPICKLSADGKCDDYSNDPIFTAYQIGGGEATLGFSVQDLRDLQNQLSTEIAYLGDVGLLSNYLQVVYNSGDTSMGAILSSTASNLVHALTSAKLISATAPSVDKVALSADILSDVAGAASVVAGVASLPTFGTNPVSGAASIFSGILGTAASVLNTIDAAHPTAPPADPNVVVLSDLEWTIDNRASDVVKNFALDLNASTTNYFYSVYSDWYRLQSMALMAINTDPTNVWYIARTNGSTASQYLTSLAAGAKNQLYMAILPQHFVVDTYPGMGDGYNDQTTGSLLQTCYNNSQPPDATYDNPTPSVYPDKSWYYNNDRVTTLNSLLSGAYQSNPNQPADFSRPGRDVYVIRSTQNSQGNWGFWTSDIGDDLMSQPAADITYGFGNIPLNLNQNWFFESNIFQKIYLGCPAGGGPGNFVQH